MFDFSKSFLRKFAKFIVRMYNRNLLMHSHFQVVYKIKLINVPFKLKYILHYTFKCPVHNPVTFCHFVFNVFSSTINLKFIFVSVCNGQISSYIDNVIDHDLLKVFMKRKSFYTLVNEQQKMITSA